MTYSTAYDIESSFDALSSDLGNSDNSTTKAVMSDIYGEAKPAMTLNLKAVDHSSPDIDRSVGFNPYDTGVLQQNKIER